MSDRRVYESDRDEGRKGPRSFLLGAGVLAAVGAAAGWWMLRAGAERPSRAPEKPGNAAVAGKPWIAATHVVPGSPKLEAGADGKSVLTLVLRDVKEGETVFARHTDSARAGAGTGVGTPGDLRVFLTTTPPAEGTPGTLSVEQTPPQAAGDRTLVIPLPRAADRVAVIDLRWEGGRWEGFEVASATAAAPK